MPRHVIANAYGTPDVLSIVDEPTPPPGDGHVVVAVRAAGVNPADVKTYSGAFGTDPARLPLRLGFEAAGVVTAVGAGVDLAPGDEVIAFRVSGAYADEIVAPASALVGKPAGMGWTEAAGLMLTGATAVHALTATSVREGDTVLIHAAAGGVGSAALQLAKAAGARVIATAGSADKLAFCRELGADIAVNYRTDDIVEACNDATGGYGVDLVFDGVGGDVTQASLRALARNGRLMIIGFASGIEAEEIASITPRQFCFGQFSVGGVLLSYRDDALGVRKAVGFNVTPRSVGDAVETHLDELLARGAIKPVVSRTVGYRELPAALDAMEARQTIGRVVVNW